MLLAVVFMTLPVNWAAAQTDLGDKIAAAKTAADHQAIAAQFEQEAKDLEAKATWHQRLGETLRYGSVRSPEETRPQGTLREAEREPGHGSKKRRRDGQATPRASQDGEPVNERASHEAANEVRR
jgi:hypothetical protein